jgi:hypothetical protein
MAGQRGIREIPTTIDSDLRGFLVDLQQQVKSLRGTQAPIAPPTNFKVTAQAFGNLLQWTRTTGADYYQVLWNTVPTASTANIQGVGDSAMWVDHIGQTGIKRYYWVRACRYTGTQSLPTPGLSGTTLGSATGVTPPKPPPPAKIMVLNPGTGHLIPYDLSPDYYK